MPVHPTDGWPESSSQDAPDLGLIAAEGEEGVAQIVEAVGEIAEARGVTYPQIALAWLRVQPVVSSVIIGVRTLAQLEDNLGAANLELTPAELAKLDAASTLPEMYPYRFLENYQRTL